MNKPIKTGIASYGLSGATFHAPFLISDKRFQIVKVLERSKNLSEGKIPGSVIVRNYNDLTDDPEIELIVVNTPNNLHFQMSKEALEKGKHIIVEKPFTTNVAEAEELLNLAKKRGLIIAVYQNRRFDIDFQTVKKVLTDGILGNIKLFESKMYRWKPDLGPKLWKTEPGPAAGLLYDLGSHIIDQALVLFGKPKSVFADLAVYREGGKVDDYFEVVFDYGNMKAHLKGFLLSAINEPRFSIYGHKASYQKFGPDIQEPTLISGILPGTGDWSKIYANQEGKIYKNDETIIIKPTACDYRNFFSNVYEVLREGAELLVKPHEAVELIRMIETAIQSHTEKRWIEI